MPSSPHDSLDSPTPSGTPSADGEGDGRSSAPPGRAALAGKIRWGLHAGLFLATATSVFSTYYIVSVGHVPHPALEAAEYAAALLCILLCHEFGHYIAARIHGVDATLPFFIPMPIPPFGTMGAVIQMRGAIRTRRALLDIGAAGPLAGLAVAVPLYAWGVAHSQLVAVDGTADAMQLGDSLLLRALDRLFGPHVAPGMDIWLSPVAFAAWAGMFVTMINLIPAGQLDGGHVAYALFGARQNAIARWVHRSMLAFFFVILGSSVLPDLRAGAPFWHMGRHVNDAIFWLVWFEILAVLGSLAGRARRRPRAAGAPPLALGTRVFGTLGLVLIAGALRDRSSPFAWATWFAGLAVLLVMEARWGALGPATDLTDHPETGPEPLGPVRAVVAVVTLAFFVALFMPTPMSF
jgi:membrane-associated protease RseP (regulator of RpoE activity)